MFATLINSFLAEACLPLMHVFAPTLAQLHKTHTCTRKADQQLLDYKITKDSLIVRDIIIMNDVIDV